jgi:hypothetical protein
MNQSWQFESNNPWQSTGWNTLREFREELYTFCKELVIELNQINAPVHFRMERKPY